MGVKINYRVSNHLPVDLILNTFYDHLNIEGNLRTFFSAKFGAGKTYFLQEFFDKYSHKYEVVRVFPINYSTAQNSDIFELIKFDILFHLMRFHEEKVDKIAISNFIKFQWFIKSRLNLSNFESNLDILSTISEQESLKTNFPIWTNGMGILFKIFQTAKKEYKTFLEEVKDDETRSVEFLEEIMKKKPEYGDDDPIISIIKDVILKIHKENKDVVLLIDDLDRLDPEHLFRILNVFGNHLSISSSNKMEYVNENKFGFQKIIIVGDIRNIQGIFCHRYGKYTDFEGYFSKYYSKSIFNFDLRDLLLEKNIELGIVTVRAKELLVKTFLPQYFESFTMNALEQIFILLIDEGQIGFRSLVQKKGMNPPLITTDSPTFSLYNSNIYKVFSFYKWFFDSKDNVISVFSNCKDFAINQRSSVLRSNIFDKLFEELLIFKTMRLQRLEDFDKIKVFQGDYRTSVKLLNSDSSVDIVFKIVVSGDKVSVNNIRYGGIEGTQALPAVSGIGLILNFIENYI